jgi:enediyne biosynthesis protein E4
VLHNATPDAGNWIGFRLDSVARPWAGARVQIETGRGAQTRWLVTGDSYRSQHAPAAHFGLGEAQAVNRAEVLWPDGSRTTLPAPEINRWHDVRR